MILTIISFNIFRRNLVFFKDLLSKTYCKRLHLCNLFVHLSLVFVFYLSLRVPMNAASFFVGITSYGHLKVVQNCLLPDKFVLARNRYLVYWFKFSCIISPISFLLLFWAFRVLFIWVIIGIILGITILLECIIWRKNLKSSLFFIALKGYLVPSKLKKATWIEILLILYLLFRLINSYEKWWSTSRNNVKGIIFIISSE